MLDQYLDTIQEGYILSDKNISVDLDKFENGTKNKLIIIGTSGSGKTTIGEALAKKYKVKWISIDSMWWRLKEKYFKGADLRDREVRKLVEKKVQAFVVKVLKRNERFIIEGIDILNIYKEKPKYRKLILSQSMIILGLSSLRAGIRAAKRNQDREDEEEGLKVFYWMLKFNIKKVEPFLKLIRKDVKTTSAKIEEYKIPKL